MKKIVIAPYLAHQNLYEVYRKDDPFCDVKFYSKSSFLKEAYYQYSDEAIIYLIRHFNLDYSLANNYLSIIKKLNIKTSSNKKIQNLIDIKEKLLSNDLLFKNEYFDYELENAEIDIYYYQNEDKELSNILKDKKFNFISFNNSSFPDVYNFASSVDELNYVFNKISELIEQGVKPSDISIYGLTDSDELTFNRFKENYKLNFNNAFPKSFLAKNYINRFLIDMLDIGFDEAINKAITENETDETINDFKAVVERYRIEEISLQNQSNLYKEIFKKKSLESVRFVDAINVVNEPIAKSGKYLFIVNFIQGKFPPIIRDDGYLSNKEKAEIGLVTTEDENHANLKLFEKYLLQNANIFVSFSNRSSSEKYNQSPFLKLHEIKVESKPNILSYYSLNEAKISYADLLDLRINYLDNNPLLNSFKKSGIKINYRNYDYTFGGTTHFSKDIPLTVSYSQIKTYCECQYKYYLDRVLKLDECEPNIFLSVGTLAHNIFERLNEKPFDELFSEEYMKLENQFGPYDFVYLNRIKEEIKKTYDYIVNFESQIDNPHIERETSGTLDHNPIQLDTRTFLEGRIDKAITFGEGSKYLFIVDYKSGHEEYKSDLVQYGLSLQLPTYALIASKGKKFSNKVLAGLFIQRFLASKEITSFVESPKDETPTLEGVFLDDIKLISQADKTLLPGTTSKYIGKARVKVNGEFNSKRAKSKEYFDDIAQTAEKVITNSVHSILSNEFAINPKVVAGKDKSCSYCPYRDICFRDLKAFVIYSSEGDETDAAD